SCSPAAAATLLRHYDIPATETELVDLCLTRLEGTSLHGLYRGLKLKTAGTPWDVEAFNGNLEQLHEYVESGPVILNVRLPFEMGPESIYVTQWGWVPGQGHTVVVLRMDDRKVL